MQVTRQLELEDTANECNLEPVEGSDSEGSDGTSLKDEEWLIIDEVTDKCIHCIATIGSHSPMYQCFCFEE